jgi:glycosyltransferase involved in cell wall biosynthesis
MKVLFQSRVDLFDKKGGDTIQIMETKNALQALGVAVDVDCGVSVDVSMYDIVHVFNLDWVCEPYLQIKNAKKQGKKVVLSPIHHSLKEFERYEKFNRWGIAVFGNTIIPSQQARDVARNLVKGILYPKKLVPALIQLGIGIRNEQRLSVNLADYILVQTNLEALDLKEDYKTLDFKWKKVVNGIDPKKFGNLARNAKEKIILLVGRIEPRKNQINLAKAFSEAKKEGNLSEYKLVFVGGKNPHHPTYLREFFSLLKGTPDITYLGYLDQNGLCELYKNAKVFCCPSWFETTGLVLLEAAVCGADSLVASGDRAREYLRENSLYCDPQSVTSIKNALVEATLRSTVKKGFPKFVKENYTWEKCARQTLEVYEEVLKK